MCVRVARSSCTDCASLHVIMRFKFAMFVACRLSLAYCNTCVSLAGGGGLAMFHAGCLVIARSAKKVISELASVEFTASAFCR